MCLALGGAQPIRVQFCDGTRAHEPRRNVQQPLFRCLPSHRANRQVSTVDGWLKTDIVAQIYPFWGRSHHANDTEKISMDLAQGWHAQTEKCNTCFLSLRVLLFLVSVSVVPPWCQHRFFVVWRAGGWGGTAHPCATL